MASVKIPNESIMPRTIPNGRRCEDPAIDEDRTIGKRGQIHGARMVTKPERKAKNNKPTGIFVFYTLLWNNPNT